MLIFSLSIFSISSDVVSFESSPTCTSTLFPSIKISLSPFVDVTFPTEIVVLPCLAPSFTFNFIWTSFFPLSPDLLINANFLFLAL